MINLEKFEFLNLLSQKPSFLGQHENRHPKTSNVLQNLNYRFLSKKCLNEKLLSKKRRFLILKGGRRNVSKK